MRIVVLGAEAPVLSAANRLAVARLAGTEILVVDRAADHAFWPGMTSVLFSEAEPAAIRRPTASLLASRVRLVTALRPGVYCAATSASGNRAPGWHGGAVGG